MLFNSNVIQPPHGGDLTLSLFVSRVAANDPDRPLAFDDLTFITDGFYGTSDLHGATPFLSCLVSAILLFSVIEMSGMDESRTSLTYLAFPRPFFMNPS